MSYNVLSATETLTEVLYSEGGPVIGIETLYNLEIAGIECPYGIRGISISDVINKMKDAFNMAEYASPYINGDEVILNDLCDEDDLPVSQDSFSSESWQEGDIKIFNREITFRIAETEMLTHEDLIKEIPFTEPKKF